MSGFLAASGSMVTRSLLPFPFLATSCFYETVRSISFQNSQGLSVGMKRAAENVQLPGRAFALGREKRAARWTVGGQDTRPPLFWMPALLFCTNRGCARLDREGKTRSPVAVREYVNCGGGRWRLRRMAVVCLALLFGATMAASAFTTVVIDPGHGGHDRGGIPGQVLAEKTYALDVALRLERVLRRAGLKTVMTRRTDVFIPLATRCALANRTSNAIFVSVHFNSAQREGARGIETYSYGSEGYRLAYFIHRRLIHTTRAEDRGLKQRGFYVLRNTKRTAVLLELGFLTNGADARLARSSGYRQKLATAAAAGILDYKRAKR